MTRTSSPTPGSADALQRSAQEAQKRSRHPAQDRLGLVWKSFAADVDALGDTEATASTASLQTPGAAPSGPGSKGRADTTTVQTHAADGKSPTPKPASGGSSLTPTEARQRTEDIRAAMAKHSGRSPTEPSVDAAETLTPLQRALYWAVNHLPRAELERHPELLKAVQDGFATEGGQELAFTIHMMDARIVGDLSHPTREPLLNWRVHLRPETIAHIVFSVHPSMARDTRPLLVEWVRQAQTTEVGREQIRALMSGPRVVVKAFTDPKGLSVQLDRVPGAIYVRPGASGAMLQHAVTRLAIRRGQPVDGPASLWRKVKTALNGMAGEESAGMLVSRGIQFDDSIPREVRRIIEAVAKHSPTLRNVLIRSIKEHGRVIVAAPGTDVKLIVAGEWAGISLDLNASPAEQAKALIFELCNAAQSPLLSQAKRASGRMNMAEVDALSVDMFAGMMFRPEERAQVERSRFLNWVNTDRKARSFAHRLDEESVVTDESLITNKSLMRMYLDTAYPNPRRVRQATMRALSVDAQEVDSVLMTGEIGAEIGKASKGRLGPFVKLAFTPQVLEALQSWEPTVRAWEDTGDLRGAALEAQLEQGHTGLLMHQLMLDGFEEEDVFFKMSEGEPVDAKAVLAADEELTRSASTAGAAAREAAAAAVKHHGPAAPAAAEAAVHSGVRAECQRLAKQIFAHPQVLKALERGGEAVNGLAVAAMVAELGQAIHLDVTNGDHEAHATREVLSKLIGGLAGLTAGAEAGALAGTAAGATLGSLLPVVGTAVGGFIGGLLGGLAGGAAGFELGSRSGDWIYKLSKKPVDHLLDELLADLPAGKASPGTDPGRTVESRFAFAQQLISLGSRNDDHANRRELEAGFDAAGIERLFDRGQLDRLIAAFDADGNGALSSAELTNALSAGALLIENGQAGINPHAALTSVAAASASPQIGTLPGQGNDDFALNTARRVVGAGSKDDALVNIDELIEGFEAAGYELDGDDEQALGDLLLARGAEGVGAVNAEQLAAALADGALTLDPAGRLGVRH